MTMEEPVSREELEGQARIRHADGLELVSGVYKSVIEEVWAAYEKGRGEAQLRYERESAELLEILNEELEVIAAGERGPGPVPEVDPLLSQDPHEPGLELDSIPFVDVPGPGIDPGEEPWIVGPVEVLDILAILTAVGHTLARSGGEGKVIADGLEALQEVIDAQGDDNAFLLDAIIARHKTKGGNHEID